MEELSSTDHAKIIYRDWLEALRNLRKAQSDYVAAVSKYESAMKKHLGLSPEDKLERAHQRMASMQADSDDVVKVSRARTMFYMELVRTLAVSYQVEVDYGWRFGGETL